MLRIIDLEYAGLNYRAFDLGNLFCEFAINYGVSDFPGFTLTRDEYPGLEAQAEMVEAYAAGWRAEAARRPSMAEDPATSSSGGNGSRHGSGGVGGGGGASEVLAAVPEDSAAAAERWARTSTSPMAIDALLSRRARRASAGEAALEHRLAVEARLGMLASHIYWSAWAAVMAAAKLGSPTAEPAVGFSYSVYGLVRAKEYARMKRQLLLDGGGGAEL